MGYGAVRLQSSRLSSFEEESSSASALSDGQRRPSEVRRKKRANSNWRRLRDRVVAGSVIIRSFKEWEEPCRHGVDPGSCLLCQEGDDEQRGEVAPLRAGVSSRDPSPIAARSFLSNFAEAVSGTVRKIGQLGHCVPSAHRGTNGSRPSLLRFMKKRKREDMDALPYDLSLSEMALALAAYLLVGVLAFSVVFEKWDVVDSCYFSMVTFTTIGYGDLVPKSQVSLVFTSLFALTGIAFLGVGLGIVGSRVVESEILAVKAAERDSAHAFSILMGRSQKSIQGDSAARGRVDKVMSRDEVEEHIGENRLTLLMLAKFLRRFWPALLSLFLGALAIAWREGWTVCETLYFCVVTTTTIGYGDYTPEHSGVKWAMVFYIPLAVGIMGHIMAAIADFIIEKRREVHQKKLWCRDLTMGDLEAMDGDHKGAVSQLDYVEFMLVALKKVDHELLDELHKQFEELDVSCSGEITKHDLKLLAKKRLKRVRHKLELSSYKYKLLHVESDDLSNSSRSEHSKCESDVV